MAHEVCSTSKVSLSSVSTEEGRFFSMKDFRFFRKDVTGYLLAVIYLIILLLPGFTSAIIQCDRLNNESKMEEFMSCKDDKMRIEAINGSYPVADFSDFSQEDFESAMTPKQLDGKTPFYGEKMKNRLFAGNFLASGSQISQISVGFYVSDSLISQSFTLIDNWNLTNVTIETPTNRTLNFVMTMNFTIRNNKRLSKASLDHLNSVEYKLDGSYIQGEGECTLNQIRLSSLEDLEYCQYTTNDLIINDETDIDYKPKLNLKEVRGCITIKNTNLTDLSVLSTIETVICHDHHEITNNFELCTHPEDVFKLRKRLNATLVYKDNSNCSGECSSKHFMSEEDPTCVIITDSLTIANMSENANLSYFSNVEQILGRLIMRDNNLTDLSPGFLFPKLKLIDASRFDVPSIEVRFNYKLVNFELPNITITNGRSAILSITENGNFEMSKDEKEKITETFGTGSVTTDNDETHTNVNVINVASNSSSGKSSEEEPEEESNLVAIVVGVFAGITLLIIVGIVICSIFVAREVKKKKKEILSNYRIYDSTSVPRLKTNPFDMVIYPYDTTNAWMTAAGEILRENMPKIQAQEQDRLKRKKTETELFIQKNSNPSMPIYSRFDAKHQNFSEHYLGPYRTFNPLGTTEETKWIKKCLSGCGQSRADHPPVCFKTCKCSDVGIKVNSNYIFGIRMQKVPIALWDKQELEKNHFFVYKQMDPAIIYEELSDTTAQLMEKYPTSFIDDEMKYQKDVTEQPIVASIDGKVEKDMDKIKELKTNKKKKEAEENDTGCTFRHTMTLYTYQSEKNQLQNIKDIDITPAPMNDLKAFFKTFGAFAKRIVNPCTKTDYAGEDNNRFMDNMIKAHMNCPVGRWVTNYTVEDIMKLCEFTKEKLGNPYVEMDNVNARIIGDIRGKFDDLRKGLSLPSANAPTAHPLMQTSHIFLGNYAGPFRQSMEVICLLFALKSRYPDKIILLRGALEWRMMGDVSSLKGEVFTRFKKRGGEVYAALNEVFECLPFVCKLGKNILCSHAGIAPRMKEVKDLSLPIVDLVPDTLPFNLVFAQPNWTVKRFFDNVDQNAGYYFGYETMKTTLDAFGCKALFCSKPLKSGFGIAGKAYRLFSVSGHQATLDHKIAQAEYDRVGNLHFQVIHIPTPDDIEFNDEKPYELNEEEKAKTNSKIMDVIPRSKMENPQKSTMSVVKTQCDSVVNAPSAQDNV